MNNSTPKVKNTVTHDFSSKTSDEKSPSTATGFTLVSYSRNKPRGSHGSSQQKAKIETAATWKFKDFQLVIFPIMQRLSQESFLCGNQDFGRTRHSRLSPKSTIDSRNGSIYYFQQRSKGTGFRYQLEEKIDTMNTTVQVGQPNPAIQSESTPNDEYKPETPTVVIEEENKPNLIDDTEEEEMINGSIQKICYRTSDDFHDMLHDIWPSIENFIETKPNHDHSVQWKKWIDNGLSPDTNLATFFELLLK